MPYEIFHDSNVVANPPGRTGHYLKHIVVVGFAAGTPRAQRQAAIDLIGGRVIGGARVYDGGSDGWYIVRVAGDSLMATVSAAITTLRTLPHVDVATPVPLDDRLASLGSKTDSVSSRNARLPAHARTPRARAAPANRARAPGSSRARPCGGADTRHAESGRRRSYGPRR